MALVLLDRAQETATANTTVSFTMLGAVTGYQSFAGVGDTNTTYYGATDGTNWETGIGTYSTTGPTLTRTTILASSNAGAAVTFSGGVTIFIDYPSGKSLFQDASGNSYIPNLGATTASIGQFTTGAFGGTQSTGQQLLIGGNSQNASTNEIGIYNNQIVQSAVTSSYTGIESQNGTAAASFTLSTLAQFSAYQGVLGSGSSVTTQYGYLANANINGATNNYGYFGNIASATGRWNFYAAGTAANYMASYLGIGTTVNQTTSQLVVGGTALATTTSIYGISSQTTAPSTATASSINYYSVTNTAASAFTLSQAIGFQATQGTIGSGSTITAQYGFFAASTLTGATNNYGFYGNLAAATGRWNLYMNGTAANYMAGQLGIGTTSLTSGFFAVAGTQSTTATMVYVGGTNTNASAALYGTQFATTITGTTTNTNAYGLYGNTTFNQASGTAISSNIGMYSQPTSSMATGSTLSNFYGFLAYPLLNTTVTPSAFYGYNSQVAFTASATGGTITQGSNYVGQTPFFSTATTGFTGFTNFISSNIIGTATASIATVIGYYSGQAATNTGVSSNWNFYAAGTAPNYMAGSLGINSTGAFGTGYFVVGGTQSTSQAMSYIGGSNTNTLPNIYSFYNGNTLTGTTATTGATGIYNAPAFALTTGATLANAIGITSAPALNNNVTPTNYQGVNVQLFLGAAATGGTIASGFSYIAQPISFNASSTTGFTNHYGYFASNVAGTANNAIGTVYGFYSNQAASNTGVTNNWNFYANGTAPNFFNGDMRFNKTVTATGTTGAQTISKNAGTVNFAAAATSLVVTNTLVTTSSIIIATVGTNDNTMKSVSAVAAAGSFTLYANAAATAETRVNFIVIN